MSSGSSKGQIGFEIAWVFLAIVVLVMGVVFVYPAISDLNDDIQADASLSPEAKSASQSTAGNFATQWDNVLFFLMFLLWGFLVIAAFFADTHPVFAFITIILTVFGIVAVMIVASAYIEATEDAEVSSAAAEFPKMDWVINHIVIIMVLMAFSVMMVLYARNSL